MKYFLRKNSLALAKAGCITLSLVIFLSISDLSLVHPDQSPAVQFLMNTIFFVLCWWLIFYLINKFSIYRILGTVALLVTAILAEKYLDISENPITIPLLILFWLSVASFVIPDFFQKYRTAIISVYALVIAGYYFFFFNITPENINDHRLNFANFMILPLPVFAILWLYEQWRWLRTLQAEKAQTELALLKSQINPHFFFNTLNNLYGLVVEKSDTAPNVVLKLSEMMRYTIYQGKKDFVSLKEEIKYLENYIELHRIRYQKKVDISFSHDVSGDLKIAPLLFIILLENAFKHGVEKMREQAYIHLTLHSKGKSVFFSIKNSYDPSAQKQDPGIGMDNLKRRLEHTYPKKYELKIVEESTVYKVRLNLEVL